MRKSHGSERSSREAFVPGTSFHMDFGFIQGPKNLQEVLHNGAPPKETIIKSHDGFSSYLLVIAAATQYIWTFLLNGKDPPSTIIDQFLNKHGTRVKGMITTAGGGLLHKSKRFNTICNDKGYQTTTAKILENLDFEGAGVDSLHHVIPTGNGVDLPRLSVLPNVRPRFPRPSALPIFDQSD
jgi:hypothetical protein